MESIAIITCGIEHKNYEYMKDWIDRDGDYHFYMINAREKLDDPAKWEQLNHWEDGDSLSTQVCVYSQPKFAPLITDVADSVVNYDAPKLLFVFCRRGYHRAHTCGKTWKSVFTRIKKPDGSRRFDVLLLPLHKTTKLSACWEAFESARRWIDGPYSEPSGESPADPRSQLYAYEASRMRPACATSFRTIYDWVFEHNCYVTRDAPTDEPVWKRARTDGFIRPSDLVVDIEDHDMMPYEVAGPTCMATAWKSVLNEFGVDITAQQELFLLSQAGPVDYRHANGMLAKLLKKEADGEELRNPSAFLHSCIKNCRNAKMWK